MNDPLVTYLADHLAGAVHAIELAKTMRDRYPGEPIGSFAGQLVIEIESDREVLKRLSEQVGGGPSVAKEVTAWAGEKFSRLKFRHQNSDGLETFEALEYIGLGILGKLGLWRVLGTLARENALLQGPDYDELVRRAQDQHARIEQRRLELAQAALIPKAA